jgi:DNA primase
MTAKEIEERLNIVDVASETMALKKVGVAYKGLCPFHPEKSPSFLVYPKSQRFHCFGCRAHGNVIDFVIRSKSISFADALVLLEARLEGAPHA